MLKSEIVEGKIYLTAAGLRLKVLEIVENDGRKWFGRHSGTVHTIRANTRYRCLNLATGRENVVKGAAKFTREIKYV